MDGDVSLRKQYSHVEAGPSGQDGNTAESEQLPRQDSFALLLAQKAAQRAAKWAYAESSSGKHGASDSPRGRPSDLHVALNIDPSAAADGQLASPVVLQSTLRAAQATAREFGPRVASLGARYSDDEGSPEQDRELLTATFLRTFGKQDKHALAEAPHVRRKASLQRGATRRAIRRRSTDTTLVRWPRLVAWREQVHLLLTRADSSRAAYLLSVAIMLVIVTSSTTFCLETMPRFGDDHSQHIFGVVELVSIVVFTVEYVLKITTAPRLWAFVFSPMNVIDLAAILPFYIGHIFTGGGGSQSRIIRVVRLVRVMRLLKLGTRSVKINLLVTALVESADVLVCLLFLVALALILFSSLVYYAEKSHPNSQFTSIPGTFWWCIVTLTTVGYGDYVPVTVAGKVIASATMVSAVIVIALPISVIGTNFTTRWSDHKTGEKAAGRMRLVWPNFMSLSGLLDNQEQVLFELLGALGRQEELINAEIASLHDSGAAARNLWLDVTNRKIEAPDMASMQVLHARMQESMATLQLQSTTLTELLRHASATSSAEFLTKLERTHNAYKNLRHWAEEGHVMIQEIQRISQDLDEMDDLLQDDDEDISEAGTPKVQAKTAFKRLLTRKLSS